MPKKFHTPDDHSFYIFRDAVWEDKNRAAEMLEESPELLELRSGLGETALQWFAVENCREEVEWLLARGSDIDTQNKFGATPLIEAVQLGYTELVGFLLSCGADPHIEYSGETALSEAVERGHEEIVRMLRKKLWERGQVPVKSPASADETGRYEAWQRAASKKRKKRSR